MTDIAVSVVRTANRHSRAVFTDSGIEIRLAKRLPRHLEEEHIRTLTERMQELAVRERMKKPIDPFASLIASKTSGVIEFPDGRTIDVTWKEGKRTSLRAALEPWVLTVAPGVAGASVKRLLWRAVSLREKERMAVMVEALNAKTVRLPVRSLELRYTTSQWGCCRSNGTISLSTALVFLPRSLQEYVIIHELSHLKYRSHGPRFWDTVETYLPNYRDAVRELRTFKLQRL